MDWHRTTGAIPTVATGAVFAPYINAARQNLTALLDLTRRLRDTEFEREAQAMLDVFNDAAADAEGMIAEANKVGEAA